MTTLHHWARPIFCAQWPRPRGEDIWRSEGEYVTRCSRCGIDVHKSYRVRKPVFCEDCEDVDPMLAEAWRRDTTRAEWVERSDRGTCGADEGCPERAVLRGFCTKHFFRWYREVDRDWLQDWRKYEQANRRACRNYGCAMVPETLCDHPRCHRKVKIGRRLCDQHDGRINRRKRT